VCEPDSEIPAVTGSDDEAQLFLRRAAKHDIQTCRELDGMTEIPLFIRMYEKISIGRRGAITLPARLRKKFGLEQNDELIIEETEQGLLLRPAISMPVEIYTEERIREFTEDDAAIGEILDRSGMK